MTEVGSGGCSWAGDGREELRLVTQVGGDGWADGGVCHLTHSTPKETKEKKEGLWCSEAGAEAESGLVTNRKLARLIARRT
jgi:hypothetical protein